MYEYRLFYERRLPHFQPTGATLFITARLYGSIPKHVLEQLMQEAEHVRKLLEDITDLQERARLMYIEQRRAFGKWDKYLDETAEGPRWLQEPQIAGLVAKSIHHRDGRVYDLIAYCIMANHMHLVFTPLKSEAGTYHAIATIMHSLKRHTAREANLLLHRSGQFWQHESYDHFVRDSEELQRIIAYTRDNPVKAGLAKRWQDWPWTYCKL